MRLFLLFLTYFVTRSLSHPMDQMHRHQKRFSDEDAFRVGMRVYSYFQEMLAGGVGATNYAIIARTTRMNGLLFDLAGGTVCKNAVQFEAALWRSIVNERAYIQRELARIESYAAEQYQMFLLEDRTHLQNVRGKKAVGEMIKKEVDDAREVKVVVSKEMIVRRVVLERAIQSIHHITGMSSRAYVSTYLAFTPRLDNYRTWLEQQLVILTRPLNNGERKEDDSLWLTRLELLPDVPRREVAELVDFNVMKNQALEYARLVASIRQALLEIKQFMAERESVFSANWVIIQGQEAAERKWKTDSSSVMEEEVPIINPALAIKQEVVENDDMAMEIEEDSADSNASDRDTLNDSGNVFDSDADESDNLADDGYEDEPDI